jgi:hypothetical protein
MICATAVQVRACRCAACWARSASPCSQDVRRHGGGSRSTPRCLRSGWRTRRSGRTAPAVPWHHRPCAGAGMCADHCGMEAAEAAATAADTVTAVGAGLTDPRTKGASVCRWETRHRLPDTPGVSPATIPTCRCLHGERVAGGSANPRGDAATHRAIAEALNARGVRTARGGAWHDSTVRNLFGGNASDRRSAVGGRTKPLSR